MLKHSPALDAGDDAQAPATDQRGMARPGLEASDIGAYEVQAPPEFSSRLQYFPVNPCPGYNLYSTLVITNTSEFRILHNITATVTLPAGTWFFPGQASGMDYTYDGNTIVFTADTLEPEEIALAELTIPHFLGADARRGAHHHLGGRRRVATPRDLQCCERGGHHRLRLAPRADAHLRADGHAHAGSDRDADA